MKTSSQYNDYRKPSWAPPAWLFGPVWTFLYILIAISFGYTFYLFAKHEISFLILLPFILNLVFNLLYTPIQFRWRNFGLAALDVLLVWVTLVWVMALMWHREPWIAYINIPYLTWVTFATILQFTVTLLNK